MDIDQVRLLTGGGPGIEAKKVFDLFRHYLRLSLTQAMTDKMHK